MPTVFTSGSRSALPRAAPAGIRFHRPSRRNWRRNDRSRSRPGARRRAWPNPLTELETALRALIRFHESHPDWFLQESGRAGAPLPAALDPEWEAAIDRAYHSVPGSTRVSRVHPGGPPGNDSSLNSSEFA